MPDEKKILIIGLLWARWEARYKINAGEDRKSIDEVIYKAWLLSNLKPEMITNGGNSTRRNQE